jgi:hypothetical protein
MAAARVFKGVKGVDRRDVHRSFSTTPLSASRNYSVNIPSVNAFTIGGYFVPHRLSRIAPHRPNSIRKH